MRAQIAVQRRFERRSVIATMNKQFQSLLDQAIIEKKILKSQKRMQKALLAAMKTGWEEMSEEERKMTIELGSLAQELERKLQELFKKEKN